MMERILAQMRGHPNFPRIPNRAMSPCLQNADIRSPWGPASTLFVSVIPSGVNSLRYFLTPIYAVFFSREENNVPDENEKLALIWNILRLNPTLSEYVRGYMNRVREVIRVALTELDDGFSLAVLHEPGSGTCAHEIDVIRRGDGRMKLSQFENLYDRLLYPLFFWSGTGGCDGA
jgi:hypothetical protein